MSSKDSDIVASNTRLGNKLIAVFTGKILPVLSLSIIMILFSRKLSYNDYGQFQMLWIYCNITSVLISFGLSSVILSTSFNYFISFFKTYKRNIFLLYTFGTIITFVAFYFTAKHLSSQIKWLLIIFIFLQCICTLIDTLLIKKNLFKVYLFINFIYTPLFFVIHLYFFYNNYLLYQLIFCITFLSFVKAIYIFFIPKKMFASDNSKAPDNFISNWLFIGINEITGIVARWLDKIFLLYLLSSANFAIFFNGAFEIPLFGILISSIENIMLTNMSADILNKQAAKNIFKESFKILSIIAFPLFFFLLTMHSEAFDIIFKNKYNASIPVFLISIFIIPIRITHYGVILQCYGQSKKITFGALMDIGLSLLLMFILYPLMGTRGVALAIVISTYLQAGYYLWQSAVIMQVKINVLIPYSFLLKLLMGLAVVYGMLYYVKQYFNNVEVFFAVLMFTIVIIGAGLAIYLKQTKELNVSLQEL